MSETIPFQQTGQSFDDRAAYSCRFYAGIARSSQEVICWPIA